MPKPNAGQRKQHHLIASFGCARRGIGDALRLQRNVKLHFLAATCVVGTAASLRITRLEWCALLLCIGFVIATELINTALEDVVDLACPDHHELARRAKDVAAGAVLVAAITSVLVALVVLGPRLLAIV